MEKRKIGEFLKNAGNSAKGALDKAKEKTVHVIDQNDDGKLDIQDVSVVAGVVNSAVIKGATSVMESAEESRKRMDLKLLQPVFPDTLEQAEFLMSKLIRVVDRDKKRAESDVCQGSVGFLSDKGGLRVVNIFKDSLDAFGISLYPEDDCGFYYMNPTDRDNYIALEEYFNYIKTVRINELQRVAQDLGAKYFKVSYVEECTSASEKKEKGKVKVTAVGDAEAEHNVSINKYSMIGVAAEMHMAGHAPQKPELKYLVKDTSVQNLIDLRMSGREDFHGQKFTISLKNASGIKESDAAKIDAALAGMKASGNATVTNEVKNELRRCLQYEIDF